MEKTECTQSKKAEVIGNNVLDEGVTIPEVQQRMIERIKVNRRRYKAKPTDYRRFIKY